MAALIVELPHWSARATVFDHDSRAVRDSGENRQVGGGWQAEFSLPPSAYLVEVSLDGRCEREWIGLLPGTRHVIRAGRWSKLQPQVAAPLSDTRTTRPLHEQEAIKWSRQLTVPASGGVSGLFLFVRSLAPEPGVDFMRGLTVLDVRGESVADFSTQVQRSSNRDWAALNMRLPDGYYLLRRSLRGAPRRYLPIYLSRGWQTQIFLAARRAVSLHNVSVNMARLGAGFSPDDQTASAANAVLNALNDPNSSGHLLSQGRIENLYAEKITNPWLGILAAYAVRRLQSAPGLSKTARAEAERLSKHLPVIMDFLMREIGDHPDVRALRNASGPNARFPEPPLLRPGLDMVRAGSVEISGLVPEGSLTAAIMDTLVSAGPWTSWRNFKVLPDSWHGPEDVEKRRPPQALVAGAAPAVPAAVTPFNQFLSPRAPIFRLDVRDEDSVELESLGAVYYAHAKQQSLTSPNPVTAQDVALIATAQEWVATGQRNLPATITLDRQTNWNMVLESMPPVELSRSLNLPLAEVQTELENFKQYTTSAVRPEALPLSRIQQVLAGFAVGQSTARAEARSLQEPTLPAIREGDVITGVAQADSVSTSTAIASATPVEPVSIEECVQVLREQAEALGREPSTEPDREKPPTAEVQARQKLSQRLEELTNQLLKGADFVVVTDASGKLRYGNGAFVDLVSRGVIPNIHNSATVRELERLLQNSQTGLTPLATAVVSVPDLELRRSVIEDAGSQAVEGYINVLSSPDFEPPTQGQLAQVKQLADQLALHTAIWQQNATQDHSRNRRALESIVEQLTQVLNGDDSMNQPQSDGVGYDALNAPELKNPGGGLYEIEFWGITRHELIAGAAANLLSARANAEVRRILEPIGGFLEDTAGWADGVKRRRPRPEDDAETAAFLEDERNRNNHNWHFVNLPLDVTGYDREKYPAFTTDEDIVQILIAAIEVLQGRSARFSELNALRLVTHLVGDLHQPIHVGCCYIDEDSEPPRLVRDPDRATGLRSDQGGNRILLPIGSRGVSLHSYWDGRLGANPGEEHGHNHDEVAPEAEPPAVSPELKQRWVDKLTAMIGETSAAAPVSAVGTADVSGDPTTWPGIWAGETAVAARTAYESLKIIGRNDREENKFDVSWDGRTKYDQRGGPVVRRQLELASQNLAALLNAIWAE